MSLLKAILKAQSRNESYPSPPPEIEIKQKKKKKCPSSNIPSKTDSLPPPYDAHRMYRNIPRYVRDACDLYYDNISMVIALKKAYEKGKTDCHWTKLPAYSKQYYERRVNTYKRISRENKKLHELIINTGPRIERTSSLDREWQENKMTMIHSAQTKFVLFPLKVEEILEDPAFKAPKDVIRPRVQITLQIHNAASMGAITIELFTDICPETCKLFLELLDGDPGGYGYVGTRFYRKVPHLFWSGGDVVYNNGFGCYAQRGRRRPIGAENYHFSHSMPGLLSMSVTKNDEMCGTFNITYKALPQFDLRNVVFGRVVRPNTTYDSMISLGTPFSSHPIVEIQSTKRWDGRKWIHGIKNTKLPSSRNQIL